MRVHGRGIHKPETLKLTMEYRQCLSGGKDQLQGNFTGRCYVGSAPYPRHNPVAWRDEA